MIKNLKKIENLREFTESFNQTVSQYGNGYVLAMMTDVFDLQCLESETFSREKLFNSALEIRAFHKEGETRWFRSSIEKEFQYREVEDEAGDEEFWWDEEQYLDIDEKKSKPKKGIAYATGGGHYPLPIECYKDAKIKIRNYLSFEEDTQQVYISDWRLVDFV